MKTTLAAGRPLVRRTTSDRMKNLEKRKREIEAQLQALLAREREADRRRDTRRKIIIGGAVLAHAELNPGFADALRDVLDAAVQRPSDRDVIADLLPEAPVAPEREQPRRSHPG